MTHRFLPSLCLMLSFAGVAVGLPEPTPLVKLSGDGPCDRCTGFLMPGTHLASPHATYRIDSDLPEIYRSNGVLYTTRQILPPFDTHSDGPVPIEMRTQLSNGFSAINDSFEVYLYHLSVAQRDGETRRIVVLVENEGEDDYRLIPRQVMLHGPNRGQADSVESVLAERVLREEWDQPIDSIELDPGESAIVGHTLQIGAAEMGPDSHTHGFVNGLLRCEVWGRGMPNLVVSVISIPGDLPPEEWKSAAMELRESGAHSAETSMDLLIPPPECHVRRVVGTAMNVIWRNDETIIDLADLPDDEDVFFQMATFGVQTQECPEARQSVDLLLHPPYVHPDSIGNYMMEYHVTMQLINSCETDRAVDVMFGKDDAPIGLAWQLSVDDEEAMIDELAELPVRIGWAGQRRVEGEPWFRKTMLTEEGPITLSAGESRWVSMRLMVIGTSSLPWQLHLVPVTP